MAGGLFAKSMPAILPAICEYCGYTARAPVKSIPAAISAAGTGFAAAWDPMARRIQPKRRRTGGNRFKTSSNRNISGIIIAMMISAFFLFET